MATELRYGDANAGVQVGIANGPVRTDFHHHAPPERVETPPRPSIVIPFSRDAAFVDREATVDSGTILGHIDQKCTRPGSRTALVGLGGVGKSQLAIEYAYCVQERSPETWVLWIHASNGARFEQSLRDIAGCARIFGRQDPKADIFQLVHDWLHDKAKGSWLVILDNVDDARVLTVPSAGRKAHAAEAEMGSSRSLLSFIPHCQHGSVLVTSRSRNAASEVVEDTDIIAVEPMNAEDAATLFRRKLSLPEADDAPERLASLVASLEYMPLAIVQAAAYISQRWPRCSVQQYLDDFQANDRQKTGLLSYEGGKLRRDGSAKNSILITWQMSFDSIRQARPSATDMLSLMSFCDRQGISDVLLREHTAPTDVTEEGDDEESASEWSDESSAEEQADKNETSEFEDDVVILRNYSFITANGDGRNFEMHRLVQLATQEWLALHEEKELWRSRFLTKLCKEMPSGNYENWATCRALYPHARRVAVEMPKIRDMRQDWATVLYQTAWYCLETGNGTEAERLSVLALTARKKIFEAGHEKVTRAMGMVALAYSMQGRWEEAEKLQVQVMETYKMKLGVDHLDTLISIGDLASTFWNQGRWEEAEKLQVQVMETYKMKHGVDHLETLTIMANLAATFWNQGRWEEAEKLEVQVMETRKMKLGVDHLDTLISMGNLASTFWNQGRWEEAEKLQVQVMETRKMKLGVDHPSTLIIMANLASTFYNQGRWEEAEKLEVQVMETRKMKLGVDHPSTLMTMASLAVTYWSQDRPAEAINLMRRCVNAQEAKLGPDHPVYHENATTLAQWVSGLVIDL